MENILPQIEPLGYIGGQNGPFGGYCHPVIIRVNGQEHYVLHNMNTYAKDGDMNDIRAEHKKVEFSTLDELLESFDEVIKKLRINKSLNWEVTDPSCGYDIPAIVPDMRKA